MVSAETKISDFQWKNRLLVIPKGDSVWLKKLAIEEMNLNERDVRVFILQGAEGSKYPTRPELAKQFIDRLQPDPEIPGVYLIGKDGRTILRWSLGEFDFQKLYASIDAMPMRQREMSEGG